MCNQHEQEATGLGNSLALCDGHETLGNLHPDVELTPVKHKLFSSHEPVVVRQHETFPCRLPTDRSNGGHLNPLFKEHKIRNHSPAVSLESPVSFLNANPKTAIFFPEIVLNIDDTTLFTNLLFW